MTRITFTIPFGPSGTNVQREVDVKSERIDRDWTIFTTAEDATLSIPTRWINDRTPLR